MHHNLSFLLKYLFKANQGENEKIASWVNNLLIKFKNYVNKNKIHEDEIPYNIISNVERFPDFIKQQKSRGLLNKY